MNKQISKYLNISHSQHLTVYVGGGKSLIISDLPPRLSPLQRRGSTNAFLSFAFLLPLGKVASCLAMTREGVFPCSNFCKPLFALFFCPFCRLQNVLQRAFCLFFLLLPLGGRPGGGVCLLQWLLQALFCY